MYVFLNHFVFNVAVTGEDDGIGNLQNYQGKLSCTSNTILMPRKPLSGIKLDE